MHEIEEYKPTYIISIPENFEGCIYLFTTIEPRNDVPVNEMGIGYIGSKGKAHWEIKRGKTNITESLATSQANEILEYNDNKTQLTAYDVMCIEINDANIYNQRSSDYVIIKCMDEIEFLEMAENGLIDESRLRKRVWNSGINDENWVLNQNLSRL